MSDTAQPSLREQHVRETRLALVAAGRQRFGEAGFAATSVDELATAAGVTTGALYHHFATKTALFETVFEEVHLEVLTEASTAAAGTDDPLEWLARGFEAFLDAVLDPEVQRILMVDAPSVLGLDRFIELDERYAYQAIVEALAAAKTTGQLDVANPETLARLLLGALTRAGLLVAHSPDPARTRNDVSRTLREMLAGLGPKSARGLARHKS